MRYAPAAAALSLVVAVSASTSFSATPPVPLDPRAAQLVKDGRDALAGGDTETAIGDYESALAIQPGHVTILLSLAEASRREGMQGKALRYYRLALAADPDNQYAIAGEGEALVEKGAVEKARRNLARLQQLCGSCAPAKQLGAAITKGPAPQMVSADQVKAQPVVTAN